MTNIKPVYSKSEFGDFFDISLSLVNKMIRKGEVKVIRVGERRILIPGCEVERIMSQAQNQADA